MKTSIRTTLLLLLLAGMTLTNTSCATLFGGKRTPYQQTKPLAGQPARSVRPVALVGDILLFFPIGLIVDFANGAIYKPYEPVASSGTYQTPAQAAAARPTAVAPQRATAPSQRTAPTQKTATPRKRP
ncbi:hypothetical protein [Fibrella arboris]|uniref:hypothetical protein n=1 Tax=Fibrella arboris TaxID=3242486 RepID=UPI00352251D6